MSKSLRRISCLGVAILVWLAVPVAAQYVQTNLVSDGSVPALFVDSNLVNPWGIAHAPFGPWWVSDNGTAVATVYAGNGVALPPHHPLVVQIPPAGTAAPNGVVFNPTRGFVVRNNHRRARAAYIFASEDGTVTGWTPAVSRTSAVVAITNPSESTVYKGLAITTALDSPTLWVTNFRAGVVEVYDRKFDFVTSFTDPDVPVGFAPFGIRQIDDQVFVTFALQDADKHDDVAGPGNGFVDVFDEDGTLLKRLISNGALNSPWGLALAPDDFGPFSNALLVGNFGDGMINAYDPDAGTFLGTLTDPDANPIVIDGLWGIDFGNGFLAGPTNVLFFASGPNHEANGLFGKLEFQE